MKNWTIILIRFRKLTEPSLSQVMSDSGMAEGDKYDQEQTGRTEWEKQVHSLPKNIKNLFLDSLVPKFWKYWPAAIGQFFFLKAH